jgi:energy-coupling factor transporter transmembrane protein EcfT
MNVKDKARKMIETVDRWLWKLVGEENDIIFHFLRIVLACVLLTVLVVLAAGIVALLWKAVLILVAAIVAAAPYLVAIAVVAGVVALLVFVNRSNERQRRLETKRRNAQQRQAEERQRARNLRIRQSVLAADQKTRSNIESVVASLRRFDHRLELAITPAHYTDLFGDNWVEVREFAESSCGRKVPEVSGLLVEIIILYKQAQDVPWVPETLWQLQGWWRQASQKRKWLSEILEAAQAPAPIASDAIVLDAEIVEEAEILPIPEMRVKPPPSPLGKGRTTPIPEMAVQPPPAPAMAQPSQPPQTPREAPAVAFVAAVGPAPRLSSPPTLEELQRYCIWINGKA